MQRLALTAVLGVLALGGASVAASARDANGKPASRVTSWTISDLGTLGGRSSAATAIGAGRTVVGWSTRLDGATHAFLWRDGRLRDLGTLGGRDSAALALNDRGQVVGWSLGHDGRRHAFLWQAGTMRELRTPGSAGSVATGINEHGDVSGYWWRERDPGSAYDGLHCRGPGVTCSFGGVCHDGTFGGLGTIGGSANVIDDDGFVGGSNSVFHDLPGRMILWWQGGNHVTWFQPAAGVAYGLGHAENATPGLPWPSVVGWTLANGRRVASLWDGDYRRPPLLLGTLGGATSVAHGINGRRQVVGTSAMAHGRAHGFVWQAGTMRDLGTLPGGRGSSAAAIDDQGHIVGASGTRGGRDHAVIWTPRPVR